MMRLLRVALLASLTFAGGALAEELDEPEAEGAGEIHELDYSASTIVIGGDTYYVKPDAEVQINGTFGAFTMLQKGMLVEFAFKTFSDGNRVIYIIREDAAVELL